MLLMYEPSYGGVGVLNGSLIDYSGSNATWVWHNASRKLDPKSSFRLSAPFSGVYNWYMNITTFVFASESGNWTFTDEFRNQSAFPGEILLVCIIDISANFASDRYRELSRGLRCLSVT